MNETDEYAQDEPRAKKGDRLPPAPLTGDEDESVNWRPLPIPEGDEDVDL